MGKLFPAALLTISLSAALGGCSDGKSAAVAAAPPVSATAPVEETINREPVTASGPLIVENQLDMAAQREGMVMKIVAEPDDRVQAGQLLALLDDRQLQADLNGARAKSRSIAADLKNWKAEAKVLEADYERAKQMWDAQLITKQQLDHARYKAESDQFDVQRVEELLSNAQAAERSLEIELEKTRITAPFNGVIARRYVRAGQKIAIGDRLFWISAEGPLRARFVLPAQALRTISKGQELSLTLPDFPGPAQTARVVSVSQVVDPASGTIEVLTELIRPAKELRPGMTVNLSVDPSK
jgi:membrane fusion protein, multidrug efflux system